MASEWFVYRHLTKLHHLPPTSMTQKCWQVALVNHSFQTWTGPGGPIGLTGNRIEIRFFKLQELSIIANSMNPWTRVGPLSSCRTGGMNCTVQPRFKHASQIKKKLKMRLPGLVPRHGQICNWSLTTQPSLQVGAQQKQKKYLK